MYMYELKRFKHQSALPLPLPLLSICKRRHIARTESLIIPANVFSHHELSILHDEALNGSRKAWDFTLRCFHTMSFRKSIRIA
ncbi:unnamed protein product [Ceratitis capitata]|uniref:(Mediterranean fruit fly) hypothetical protein n=1 Tax=Ceratitis capitata TaxID=7213 RepID=A0A811V321_CERCA|nr:unnamed protein product [Ceratitis capitata]